MEKVYIFGHKNPDTDTVTSAIALEYLKRSLGVYAEARVLGNLNDETMFVLDKFGFKYPKFLNDVKLQIRDIDYYKEVFMNEYSSIEDVYNYMDSNNITGVPIVDNDGKFIDIITAKLVVKASFKTDNDHLYTSYHNIVKCVNGEEILKFDDEIIGDVNAVTYKSTTFIENTSLSNNDILIVGDRHSVIEAAINNKVKLLLITDNGLIKDEHIEIAKQNRVNIIKTPYNAVKTVRKIMLSNYIRNLFTGDRPYIIYETDYYDDFIEKANSLGYNNYPVVNKDGKCKGLVRLTEIRKKNRKKVILVDHNESIQSVGGLEEAEILEVIDHHKIGDISTNNPINFRNMTVGSTNTIIYKLFVENRVSIPKNIASIMLSGIISDTLALTSPTTTDIDREIAIKLEEISELNIDEYSKELFNSSVNLEKKNESDLISIDVKSFFANGRSFRVSQIITMNAHNLLERKDKFIEALNEHKNICKCDFVILMITDILRNGSYLLYNNDILLTNAILEKALNKEVFEGMFLEDVVSRKKQIIPAIMELE